VSVGVLILAAVANTTVLATGGYFTPQAYVTLAITVGVACGSIVSGVAWTHGRYALAGLLVAVIVAGELYNFLCTAERLIISREAAPLRDREEMHTKAKARVEAAKSVVDHAPATSKRLEAAETAKATADQAVLAKSADRSYRENCRQLLQAQVDAAGTEVEAARTELKQCRQHAEQELETARGALADIKAPESATLPADKVGVAAWIIDFVSSALGSVAANGLACCLMIFGAHHHRPAARIEIVTPRPRESASEAARKPRRQPRTMRRNSVSSASSLTERPISTPSIAPTRSGVQIAARLHCPGSVLRNCWLICSRRPASVLSSVVARWLLSACR
jgi:hypothetical protein